MVAQIVPFSDEETRLLVNLEQQYEVWVEAEQVLFKLPYNLKWKTVADRDYLYEIIDRTGNGKSLGPRTPANEAAFENYHAAKTNATTRRDHSRASLDETCRLYRALRLPLIPSEAAQILREADRRSLLGTHLLVIGTNAVPAYFIEAGGRIMNASAETQDFDLAWSAEIADDRDNPVWAMLKSVDSTYTVNTERTFQARNAKAYEVELLVAPLKSQDHGPQRPADARSFGRTGVAVEWPFRYSRRRSKRLNPGKVDRSRSEMVCFAEIVDVRATQAQSAEAGQGCETGHRTSGCDPGGNAAIRDG